MGHVQRPSEQYSENGQHRTTRMSRSFGTEWVPVNTKAASQKHQLMLQTAINYAHQYPNQRSVLTSSALANLLTQESVFKRTP